MTTDAIREAMATVRGLIEAESNNDLLGELTFSPTWNRNCATIARWLVQHAGELVRKVDCEACGGDGFAWDPDERDEHGNAPCAMCDGNGYALEPLFGEGGK